MTESTIRFTTPAQARDMALLGIRAEARHLRKWFEDNGQPELANRAGEILRLAAEARTEVER